MNRLFDPDALFWRMLARGVDFVGLSLVWALLCLPVVTIAPASAALYYTTVKVFRQKETRAFKLMFRSFKENLKLGIPVSIVCDAIIVAIYFGNRVMAQHSDTGAGALMFVMYYVLMMIPIGTMLYLFPIMGRFDLKFGDLVVTSFRLALRHIPSTIIIVLMTIELINLTLRYWFPILVAPTLCALLTSLFLERIFPKYLNTEDRAVLANMTVEELEEAEAKEAARKAKFKRQKKSEDDK